MLLACDLDGSDAISLAVDIGTNTEVSLYEPGAGRRSAASCASGPAFEGAHIRDGMRAAAGAIEKVRFEGERVLFATVGEAAPVGICGSGILDAVAELYRHGDLNRWGRFQSPRTAAKQMELVPAAASGSGHAISLTQNDVQEILLAKGAIQAGLSILLDAHGLAAEAVEELVIAGAFGSYINVDNAFALGLFPGLPNARVRQVGNAAALGAKWLLISASARQRAAAIAATTQAHELTRAPDFSRRLALAMLFPSPDNPKL
jgi:uncharacterized 2Fe-2S/4Fe-4S cluster protein (DUF4445 family)